MRRNEKGEYVQFQSTLPARGATYYKYEEDFHAVISIHAPREGSDESFKRL